MVAMGRTVRSFRSMEAGSVTARVMKPRILNVHATLTRLSSASIVKLSTNPPSPPPANTHPFARPLFFLKYCPGRLPHAMKQILHPIPSTAPFVMKSAGTLCEAHPESIWDPPRSEQARSAALRAPRRRMRRVLSIAPKETQAMAVEPMKARVESEARCSADSCACIRPQL